MFFFLAISRSGPSFLSSAACSSPWCSTCHSQTLQFCKGSIGKSSHSFIAIALAYRPLCLFFSLCSPAAGLIPNISSTKTSTSRTGTDYTMRNTRKCIGFHITHRTTCTDYKWRGFFGSSVSLFFMGAHPYSSRDWIKKFFKTLFSIRSLFCYPWSLVEQQVQPSPHKETFPIHKKMI